MNNHRIVFMGTPDFAVSMLKALIDAQYQIVGVVSQPDRPVGRKKTIEPTPTKKLALKHAIPVFQVQKIRTDYLFIEELKPDLIITCAYGQILPKALLAIPERGCINVHASLLPKLRGGAPIHHAIIHGHTKTGVSIMKMSEKMDAGDIYAQAELPIEDSDNVGVLFQKLADLGSQLLIKVLPSILSHNLSAIPQNESEVTYAPTIKREEEKISWERPSQEVFNLIRGLSPNPGAYTEIQNVSIKIFQAVPVQWEGSQEVGTIMINNDILYVKTKDGAVSLLEVQQAGKKRMTIKEYLKGQPFLKSGMKFD
jgi:methionyl-tRNA formyltransferase